MKLSWRHSHTKKTLFFATFCLSDSTKLHTGTAVQSGFDLPFPWLKLLKTFIGHLWIAQRHLTLQGILSCPKSVSKDAKYMHFITCFSANIQETFYILFHCFYLHSAHSRTHLSANRNSSKYLQPIESLHLFLSNQAPKKIKLKVSAECLKSARSARKEQGSETLIFVLREVFNIIP